MSNSAPKKTIWTQERREKLSKAQKALWKKKQKLAQAAAQPKKMVITLEGSIQGQTSLLLTEIQRRDSMSRTEVLDQALLAYLEKYPVPRPKVVAPDPVREALNRIKKVNLFQAQEAQCPVNIVAPADLPAPKSESAGGAGTGIKWMQEPLAEAAEMDLGGSYVE